MSTNEKQNYKLQDQICVYLGSSGLQSGDMDSAAIDSVLWKDREVIEFLKRKEGIYVSFEGYVSGAGRAAVTPIDMRWAARASVRRKGRLRPF